MRMLSLSVLVVAATAFSCDTYSPGSLLLLSPTTLQGIPGTPDACARSLDCLDVSIDVVTQAPAPPDDPVVDVHFGNPCRRPVRVDLGRLRVLADYGHGLERLAPYDPRGEIRAGTLDGHDDGRERIDFNPVRTESAAPLRVCVDVSEILARAATTPKVAPIWFASTNGGALELADGPLGGCR